MAKKAKRMSYTITHTLSNGKTYTINGNTLDIEKKLNREKTKHCDERGNKFYVLEKDVKVFPTNGYFIDLSLGLKYQELLSRERKGKNPHNEFKDWLDEVFINPTPNKDGKYSVSDVETKDCTTAGVRYGDGYIAFNGIRSDEDYGDLDAIHYIDGEGNLSISTYEKMCPDGKVHPTIYIPEEDKEYYDTGLRDANGSVIYGGFLIDIYYDILTKERNGYCPFHADDKLKEITVVLSSGTDKTAQYAPSSTGAKAIKYGDYYALNIGDYTYYGDYTTGKILYSCYKKTDFGVLRDAIYMYNTAMEIVKKDDNTYSPSQDWYYSQYSTQLNAERNGLAPYTHGIDELSKSGKYVIYGKYAYYTENSHVYYGSWSNGTFTLITDLYSKKDYDVTVPVMLPVGGTEIVYKNNKWTASQDALYTKWSYILEADRNNILPYTKGMYLEESIVSGTSAITYDKNNAAYKSNDVYYYLSSGTKVAALYTTPTEDIDGVKKVRLVYDLRETTTHTYVKSNGVWEIWQAELYNTYKTNLEKNRNGSAPYVKGTDKISTSGKYVIYGKYAYYTENSHVYYGSWSNGTFTLIVEAYTVTENGTTKQAIKPANGEEMVLEGSTWTASQDSLYTKYKDILEMPRYNNYAPYTKGMKLEEVDIEVTGTGTDLKYRVL